ncbi:hypothetical protein M436DRAFT_44517 [Aureobasidium namibiae CBS 147.97]|uniref:Uncharacterized protein n=1 Tax=Aureobasidium namibiae CBS 147.97 TaxID=1043004 RepID=A0A074WXP7_9PEZI
MPVRLPQATGLYTCPSCASRSAPRSFSISASQLALGPESPRYMDIPQAPQQTLPDKTRLKGILPVPRNVFAGQDPKAPLKVDQATKEPSRPQSHNDPRSIWKERMAASRRKNLKEGLNALQHRRVKSDEYMATRATLRQQEREARLHRPEREDERLTAPSVDSNLLSLLQKGPLQDPNKEARLADMRQRHALKQAARQEDRQDALHSLYVNARDFIVNDAQLSTAIDKAFGTVADPRSFGNYGASVWDNKPSAPSSIVDMLNSATARGVRGGALNQSTMNKDTALTAARVRRMAAELTGGQLPSKSSF